MGRISVGEALSAGFRLIQREPAAFGAWCAIYLVLGFLPQTLTWGPTMRMFRAMAAPGGPTGPAVLAAQGELMRYQPISYLAALLILVVLPPAICRAVLFPDERRSFFLRVGARELWMALAIVVVLVMFFIGYFVALLPVLLVTGIAAAASGGNGAAAFGVLLVFPAIGVLIWALLRFSLAPVMSFAERSFRLPEAWRLSRGHAFQMFLVWLSLMALTFLVEIVLVGLGFVALGGGAQDFASGNPFAVFSRMTTPGAAVTGVVFSLLGVWFYTMWSAAWADMYRQLRPPLAETFS